MFYLVPFLQILLHLSLILQITFHFLFSFDDVLRRLPSQQNELTNLARQLRDAFDATCTGLPRRNVAEMETPAMYSKASANVNGQLSKLLLVVVSIYVAFA